MRAAVKSGIERFILAASLGMAAQADASVTLTGPTNGTFAAPVSMPMTAAFDGDLTRLTFKANGLGFYSLTATDTFAIPNPSSTNFHTQVAGSYVLKVTATDSVSGASQSNTFTVTVTGGLTIALTAPANNASASAPATFNLAATVNDTYGGPDTVNFYDNGVLVGTATTAPYTLAYTTSVLGSHALTATVIDQYKDAVVSSARTVTVVNTPPTVSLTAPTAGASDVAPATFVLAANAADANGTVTSVAFYVDGALVGTDTSSPYTVVYTTSALGSHSITAIATDNDAATTVSSAVAVAVTSAGNVSLTRSYVYDSYQRLCKTIDPESGATLVDYDTAGNIAWTAPGTGLTSAICDRGSVTAGQKITRSYDAMNRLLTVVTPDGNGNVTTTYFADGKVASLVAANGAAGANPVTTTYSYNKRRMLTQETSAQAGYLYTLGYGYDANGFQSSLTYPDTQVVSFNPDALGRATQVNAGTTNYATAITYFPNGAISGFTYGNGVIHTMTQNARFLPSRSQDTKGTTKIIDDTYVYDANGNVDYMTDAAVTTGATNRNVDLGYDALDRMIVADAPNRWGLGTYGYDSLDNLKLADQGTRQYRYSYDASNRLATIKNPAGTTVFSFTADARGNVTSKNTTTYAFDIGNRLSAVTGVQSYRYDGQGRRVQTTDANGTTKEYWVYSQSGQVLYTSEARRSQNLSYIYLGNTQVATRAVAWGSGTITLKYEHTDALGSPVVETSSTGVVAKRNTYAPFGEAYAPTAIDGTGYTGHVMDQATGLTYMQQRYMDPQVGRFLSVDPAKAGFNQYSYANNNPYRFTDPDGRWPTNIHEKIIDKAFPGLSAAQRGTLKTASSSMDSVSSGGQSVGKSYQHSMRASDQKPGDAKAASQKFISGQEAVAKQDQGKMPSSTDGLKADALTATGNAIHTATDGTSPAHTDSNGDPKVWSGLSHPVDAYQHSQAEANISNAQMDTAVSAAREVFRTTFGDGLYKQAITPDDH